MCFYRHSWANWYNFKKWALKLMVMYLPSKRLGVKAQFLDRLTFSRKNEQLKITDKNQMELQITVGVSRVSRFRCLKLISVLIFSGFFAAQTFSQTSISLDTVFVGDDGNTEDTTGYGAVSYGYYIGKYEVTNSEYSAFLNAVAATDTYVLWHQSMSIERTGLSGDYSYGVVEGQAKHPVLRVNFYNAARFANWLMNGQPTGSQDSSTTETGFYTFSDATTISSQGTRSASLIDGKNWVAIASEDEWYKAAYYDPTLNSGSGGYYQYPAGSDTAPTKSAPTADLNSVNYGGSNAVGSTTVVGSYSGAPSPYGTFDQGGNVQEWTDSIPEESKRAVRGDRVTQTGPVHSLVWTGALFAQCRRVSQCWDAGRA